MLRAPYRDAHHALNMQSPCLEFVLHNPPLDKGKEGKGEEDESRYHEDERDGTGEKDREIPLRHQKGLTKGVFKKRA